VDTFPAIRKEVEFMAFIVQECNKLPQDSYNRKIAIFASRWKTDSIRAKLAEQRVIWKNAGFILDIYVSEDTIQKIENVKKTVDQKLEEANKKSELRHKEVMSLIKKSLEGKTSKPKSPSQLGELENLLSSLGVESSEIKSIMSQMAKGSGANVPSIKVDKSAATAKDNRGRKVEKDSKTSTELKAESTEGRKRATSQPKQQDKSKQAAPEKATPVKKRTSISPNGTHSSPPIKPADKNPPWVLCVDRTNGCMYIVIPSKTAALISSDRSTFAQTYLELVRSWTANTSSPPKWIFHHCDSAGYMIPSKLSAMCQTAVSKKKKGGEEAPAVAIDALARPKHFFQSDKFPHEKASITTRMKMHKARGIEAQNFDNYRYMLCFDDDCAQELEKMKIEAEKLNKKKSNTDITVLRNCAWFHVETHTKPEEITKAANDVKLAIKKQFLPKLKWERPDQEFGIADGPYRTLHIVVPWDAKLLLEEKEKAKVLGAARKAGSVVNIEGAGRAGSKLVNITGKTEELRKVEKAIAASLAAK